MKSMGVSCAALILACDAMDPTQLDTAIRCSTRAPEGHFSLLDIRDASGATLLHRCCRHRRSSSHRDHASSSSASSASSASSYRLAKENMCLKLLLECPELVNDARNAKAKTPLYEAVLHDEDVEDELTSLHAGVVRILLDHGARMDCGKFNNEWTPVHIAAQKNRTEILRILLAHHRHGNYPMGIVDCETKEGATPIMLASREGHWQSCAVLIEFGCDVNKRNRNQRCALLSACASEAEGSLQTIKTLVEMGSARILQPPSKEVDSTGANPLHELACSMREPRMKFQYLYARFPLACESWLRAVDLGGRLPLHVCAQHGNVEAFRAMMIHITQQTSAESASELLNSKDGSGNTPLLVSCARGQCGMVQACLDFGADISIKDGKDRSCMDIASAWKYREIEAVLNRTHICLNTGNKQFLPTLGFGTFRLHENTRSATAFALRDSHYRMIDTAEFYGNESEVGLAIQDTAVKREEIFIITKVWNNHVSGNCTKQAVSESRKKLGVSYIDMVLIHWPCKGYETAFGDLLDLQMQGIVRNVGVSNFFPEHLEVLHSQYGVYPAANEIEMSCFLHREDLETYCRFRGIALISYRSLGEEGFVHKNKNASLQNEIVTSIANELNVSNSRVLLRWCIQHGAAVIPKSKSPDRIMDNSKVFDFQLNEEQMGRLDGICEPSVPGEWMENVFAKAVVMDVV